MNMGGIKLRVPFLTFLWWKSAHFCIFWTLPSVSKIIPVLANFLKFGIELRDSDYLPYKDSRKILETSLPK